MTLLLAGVGCGQAAAATTPTGGVPFGFADGLYTGRDAQLAAIGAQQTGAKVVRVLVRWGYVEKTQGTMDWTSVDDEINALSALGVKALPVVTTSPYWAQDPNDQCPDRFCPPAVANAGKYANFIDALARRYSNKLAGVEIWNEPNATFEWHTKTGPDPVRFAGLLKATAQKVRGLTIVTGGLAGYRYDTLGSWAAKRYLTAVYQAGAKGSFGALGVHPYTRALYGHPVLSDMDQSLDLVRSARNAANDTAKPLWVTEVGLSSGMAARDGMPAITGDLTIDQQGPALLEEYDHLAKMSDIKLVLFFRLRDDAAAAAEKGFGVLYSTWFPKPAYCAIANRFAPTHLQGC